MGDKALYASIGDRLPVFFQSWWLDAVCEQGWDVVMNQSEDGQFTVWPFSYVRKAGMLLLRNPQLTPYLGPLHSVNYICSVPEIEQLKEGLPRAAFYQWSCLPGMQYEACFKASGIEYRKKRTYTLDLRKEEAELWNAIHPKRKNAIRKAQQDLKITPEFADLSVFISWQSASFNAKGKQYPFSASFLEKVMNATQQRGQSMAFSATDDKGTVLGCIWLAYDHHSAYYLLSATPEQTHRGAISLLLWEAILASKKLGLQVFDFEGSMDEDIAHFFKRFGGTEIAYEDYQQTRSLLWKLKQRIIG